VINNEEIYKAKMRKTQKGRELNHVLKSENIYQLVRFPSEYEPHNKPQQSKNHKILLEEANQIYQVK